MDDLIHIKVTYDEIGIKQPLAYFMGKHTNLHATITDVDGGEYKVMIALPEHWTREVLDQAFEIACQNCPILVLKVFIFDMILVDESSVNPLKSLNLKPCQQN